MKIKQPLPKYPMSQRRNQREIRKYFQINKSEDTTYSNLQDTAKAEL